LLNTLTEELPDEKLQEIAEGPRMYKTKRKKKSAVMMSETRRLLDKFYAPFMRQLHALTNDERFLWTDGLS
jgi:hypothetical protein